MVARTNFIRLLTLTTVVCSALTPSTLAAAPRPASTGLRAAPVEMPEGGQRPSLPNEPRNHPRAEDLKREASVAAALDASLLNQRVGEETSSPLQPLVLPKGDNAVSSNAIAVPSGPATVSGMGESFSAQLTTGIATINIPFALPRGRGAAQPTLGLVYSSSGGYGAAGVGWSLVGPAFIARQTDRGIPRYDDKATWHPEQDRFAFGAQELVPICTVTGDAPVACSGALANEVFPSWARDWQYFRARIEGGFLRFFWSPDHRTWRVQAKSGTALELGVPLDGTGYLGALETNPTRANEIFRWHVVRQYDAHGDVNAATPAPANPVAFRYANVGNIRYLSDVFYSTPADNPTSTDVSQFAHHAHIAYEPRPDAAVSYRAGFAQSEHVRVASVDVTSKPFAGPASPRELVRRYHLEYELTSHVSLLASVQMEGRCSSVLSEGSNGVLGPSSCPRLPGATFDYERIQGSAASALLDSTGREFERINETLLDVPGSPSYSLDEIETSLMDVNSDSLPDVVVTAPQFFAGKHGLFLNGSGGRVGFAPAVGMTPTGVSNVDAGVLRLSNSNVTGLDLDADARIDLVHMPLAKAYSVFTPKQIGSQWTWSGREVTTASGLDPKIDFARDADRIAVMDVNADGLVDVVFSSATEVQTFFSLGRYPGGDGRFGSATWSGVASAALSDEPISTCSLWSGSPARLGDDDVRVADMNGDGLPDIVRVRSGQVVYWPGRGNGFWGTGERDDCGGGTFGQDREVRMGNAPFVGVVQPGSLLIADVNGDGMSDMVEVRFDAVDVYLNDNGGSFTDRYTVGSVPIKPNGTNPVRLADIDGSGTIDIVWGHGHEYRYIDLAGGKRPHLLRRTSNGLGKTTEFEYATSTELMLAAQAAGKPWSKVMPITTPVIVRATVRDNLDQVGRGAGTYITEYGYRDPVFDGRQREFRGFAVAETRSPGDSTSPSVTTKSTFLLGECEVAHNGSDVCSPANRWQDNWREALKGLPSVVETFDDSGTYLSTNHTGYNLRQLYTGLDGRRVVAAFTAKQESFAYDSASFHASSQQIVLDELDVAVDGISQTETRSVTRRATLGTVRTLSHQAIDNVGNVVSSTARGCVEGCSPIDEEITRSTEFERVAGDESGWMFRAVSSFVTGSAHSTPRQQTRITYNAHGDVVRTSTTLYGTLPLDRSHSAGAAVAPAPPEASGGQSGSVDTVIMEYTHDQFGHVTGIRAAPDRCSSILFDVDYAELAVEETVFGGERGPDGCGRTSFRTTASYDRGLALVTDLVGVTGQPAHQEYDGFGRIISRTLADPEVAGQLGALPTATYAYFLPDNAETHPFARVIERSQDGVNPSVPDYMERVAYVDGLGRTLAMLTEADASAGDGGSYVVGGITDYNAKGSAIRSFEPFFWTGDPNAFDLGAGAPSGYTSMLYDAFGRPTREYNLSGQIAGQVHYHALSRDVWDAEDLRPGPHWGTYATTVVDGHGRPTRTVERVHVDGTQTLDQRIVLREYLPTGETTRITQRRAGSPDTVRWMRYDSLGRLVLNVEPNTSTGFTPDHEADVTGIRAWRYAYNDAGDLVGTSVTVHGPSRDHARAGKSDGCGLRRS